jgi:peptidoglycan/xylan/chitin deacetylase (PgdA/CDA1 family)
MAYLAAHFSVIDLAALNDFVVHGKPLPPRPLLITFDDGYRDNYVNAYPVLRKHSFPAVIFLLTGRIGTSAPSWWDECAYYFHQTKLDHAALPLIGESDLSSASLRKAARETLMRALKRVSEAEKLGALAKLRSALEVEQAPHDPDLFMAWDQVRELVTNGIACQPHTVSHPIMTRIDVPDRRREITQSCEQIRQETGQTITAFAYPNGLSGDYDVATMQILRDEGITMAFTLSPGPMRAVEVRRHPLEIQRVYLGGRDSFEMFALKVMGLPALWERTGFVEEGH